MTGLLLSAGEASGDLQAADLARALRAQAPGIHMFGMGGAMMEAAGVELLFNPTSLGTVGLTEALRTVNVFRRVLALLGGAMDQRRPAAVVCIDFPGFNLRLAELAHRKGIPVFYYFSPSAWAWGRGRADRLARVGATILAVFPFEAEVYRQAGARVVFVGHPLLDRVRPAVSRDQFRAELGVHGGQWLIALLPGSRRQEVNQLLKPMLEAARIVLAERPDSRFVLPRAYTLRREEVDTIVEGSGLPVTVLEGRSYDVLNAADAGIISMGTATLEAALMGLPHVACYRVSGLTYRAIRLLVKLRYYAMPNIVLEREAVPEVTQDRVTGENLARELLALLQPERNAAVRHELAQVRVRLGEGGAVGRAAAAILERVRLEAGAR